MKTVSKLTNITEPSATTDAANKQYVDSKSIPTPRHGWDFLDAGWWCIGTIIEYNSAAFSLNICKNYNTGGSGVHMMDVALAYNNIECSVRVNSPATIDIDRIRFRRTTLTSPWYIDLHYNAPTGTTLPNHVAVMLNNINIALRETSASQFITYYDELEPLEVSPLMEVQKVVDLSKTIGD